MGRRKEIEVERARENKRKKERDVKAEVGMREEAKGTYARRGPDMEYTIRAVQCQNTSQMRGRKS